MPLWNIYHPVGAYSAEDKAELADRITTICYPSLPRFYVGIIFQEIPKESFYMGAVAKDRFVRIRADHFARRLPNQSVQDAWIQKVNDAIAPFVRDRGYDWEIHIDETPRELWSIQGIKPPEANSDAEKDWKEANRPFPFET
jgi:phenylpyruvate tautomerase PptA (4-oxalocrotonate tautomerase family)